MAPSAKPQVIIDERVKKTIASTCDTPGGACGVLVGQLQEGGRFLVAHLIRACRDPETHSEADIDPNRFAVDSDLSGLRRSQGSGDGDEENGENKENEGSETEDEGAGDEPAPDKYWRLQRKRSFYPCLDVKDLTPARLPPLARQVSRLLPGGISVIGIFFTSPGEIPKPARQRLRDLMMEISTVMRKDCPALYNEPTASAARPDDKLLLSFDPRSKNVTTSLCLDAADAKSIIRPIPVIYQTQNFIELQTRFRVSLEKPTEADQDVVTVLKAIMDDYSQQVHSAELLFSEKRLDENGLLSVPNGAGKMLVTMLIPFPSVLGWDEDDVAGTEDEKMEDVATGRMAFRGDVVGRAYVTAGTSVAFAEKALRSDLLRSMTTRIALHCEDSLVTEADEQEFDVVHELPRRILAPLNHVTSSASGKGPSSPSIMMSNYLHEGEQVRESLEVFVGLLDMDDHLSTREMLTDVERIPNQRDVDSALESVSTHSGDVEADPLQDDSVNSATGSSTAARSPSRNSQQVSQEGRMQIIMAGVAVLFAVSFALYQIYLHIYGGSSPQETENLKTSVTKEL